MEVKYLFLIKVLSVLQLFSPFSHCLPSPVSVECVDSKDEFDFHSWVVNPSLNYAAHSSDLPEKFSGKLGGANGIFYFQTQEKLEKNEMEIDSDKDLLATTMTSESANFDIFESASDQNIQNPYQNQNQSIISKQREFVEDKRPAYIYLKYCGYIGNSDDSEQVVIVTPVKGNFQSDSGSNEANLTLSNELALLAWKEEYFEIDMGQFFEGIEIEIGLYNFRSGDFFFVDQLIFVQGIRIESMSEMLNFCHKTSSGTSASVTNDESLFSISTTSQTLDSDLNEILMSTVLPSDAEADRTTVSIKPTTNRPTTTEIPANFLVANSTSASTSTSTIKSTSPTKQSMEATIKQSTEATIKQSTEATTKQSTTILTESHSTATTTQATTSITSFTKSTTELLIQSTEPVTEGDLDTDLSTTDVYDENYSVTFDPANDTSSSTDRPALLIQDWLGTHQVTFYSVLPTLALLVIFGSCFIALRERKKGIYVINQY